MEPDADKLSRAMTRKKKPTREPTPAASAERSRPMSPAARYGIVFVALALALDLALAYWGHQVWVDESRRMQLAGLSHQQAEATAAAVAERLQQYQQRLDSLARNAETRAPLDDSAQASLQQRLNESFPDQIKAQVVPAGTATASRSPKLPLSFAELDMIARAESGEEVLPEARRDQNRWELNLASAVRAADDAPVAGVILLTLPLGNLRPSLERGHEQLGQAVLQQAFGDRSTTPLITVGHGDAGETQVAEVPASYFRVAFTPSSRLWQQTEARLALPLTLLALVVALSVILALYLARLAGRRALPGGAPGEEQEPRPEPARAKARKQGRRPEAEDILDIEILDEDEALLGLAEAGNPTDKSAAATEAEADAEKPTPAADETVPEVIFRAYDVRGRVDAEITPRLAERIGQSLGSEALDQGQNALVVARDARTHSPLLAEHLVRGILSTGCNVINLGPVPTPLMYFATETLPQTQSGVMVTASHNPAEYNGFKVVMQGKSRSAEDIQNVRKRILAGDFHTGRGREEHLDIVPQYIDTIFSDVALAGDMHLVIDASNGIAGEVAPRLFEELGCRTTCIHCEPDGTFPNHPPDPSVSANLQDLIDKVQEVEADLGVALDGDGDRMTVVSASGEIVWADRLLLLFAKDIVARNPGADVVFDVKSTRQLSGAISSCGGRPIMWKTGHAPMRAKMIETGALLGGEYSGHIFIKDRWYGFDDGIYAAARLVEILSLRGESLEEALAEFPPMCSTPEIRIAVAEDEKFAIVRQLIDSGDFEGAKLTKLDGLRADFPDGWGLLRASNTSADLTLRFEAESDDGLDRIKTLFARELKKVRPGLSLNC